MGKVVQKKAKISKVKRNNQKRTKLSKQGKLKKHHHKQSKKQIQKQNVPNKEIPEEEEESDYGDDMMDMVEKDDLTFLRSAISNKSYNLLKKIRLNEPEEGVKKRRKRKKVDQQLLEDEYENNVAKISKENSGKKLRMLLPIKKQDGQLETRVIEDEEEDLNQEEENFESTNGENLNAEDEQNSDMELEEAVHNDRKIGNGKAVSTVELLACRDELLKTKKFKIGLLSSSLLENPELKISNFKLLLDFMDETNPEVYITVRKLAAVSLLEVFKDILPSYNILQVNQEGVKLKKDTLKLHNYEAVLLRSYKQYLQKLEKIAGLLRKKQGDTRVLTGPQIDLAELSVKCMCELLVTHPYFNFSTNIANFLIPLLDSKYASVRQIVSNNISQVFKSDKRGELSLTIVRSLNKYIKARGHCVHHEVVLVLLSLRIKEVNLDKEKEEETKQKKLMSHKQRILALSKRERKRNKKLEEVEKELLETKAEENKQTKQKILTEITSILFTIYFRILKQAPNSKVLSVCLEGLAKFAHCINLDFYQDLVNVINNLMEEHNLGLREQMHCIQCVFTILSGQGTALNIDPHRFYSHLYKNLLNIHAGKTHAETEILIKILEQVLIQRRKRITQARLIAFTKRIGTLSLQTQHNVALGLLCIVKQTMQLGKAADILLDTDSSTGNGSYQPELDEPEYCNANCTSLWELTALQRHYHSTVQKMAKNIAWSVPTNGEGSLAPEIAKLSPMELYVEYDPSEVAFKPTVPIPKKVKNSKSASTNHTFTSANFEKYLNNFNIEEVFETGYVDFYKEYNKKDN